MGVGPHACYDFSLDAKSPQPHSLTLALSIHTLHALGTNIAMHTGSDAQSRSLCTSYKDCIPECVIHCLNGEPNIISWCPMHGHAHEESACPSIHQNTAPEFFAQGNSNTAVPVRVRYSDDADSFDLPLNYAPDLSSYMHIHATCNNGYKRAS